jgi:DNA-binding CsgD family transcriptional regulator
VTRLSNGDLQGALTLIREVHSAPDLDAYRERVLGVSELIPCQEIGYNEVEVETGQTYVRLHPPESAFPGITEAFSRWSHQHPVIRHHAETGDPTPRAISDFLSVEELHALDLYREVYARMGAEDQISFILPSEPGMIVGIALNRATRGFTDAERELLELVRPHLAQAFRGAHLRERADPTSPRRLAGLGLTEREAEVMRLLVAGHSAAGVAEELTISVHTARRHIANIYSKLEVENRAGAVAKVLRRAEL